MPCASDVSSQSAGAVLSRNAASPAAELVHPLSPPADAAEPIRSMPRFRRTRRICPAPAESSAMIPDLSPLSPSKDQKCHPPPSQLLHLSCVAPVHSEHACRAEKIQRSRYQAISHTAEVSSQSATPPGLAADHHISLQTPCTVLRVLPSTCGISHIECSLDLTGQRARRARLVGAQVRGPFIRLSSIEPVGPTARDHQTAKPSPAALAVR